MKTAFAIGVMMLSLGAGLAGAHSNNTCPPRGEYILVDLTAAPGGTGTVYHVDYEMDHDLSGNDWIYTENGVLAGVQTGNNHAVLGANWGHDHRCYWPVAAQRDLEWY